MTKGYLIDMDGVVYRGSQLIPGVVEFVEQLKRDGTPFLFLTNNSERTPKDFVSKLGHLGLKVSWKNFYTAAHCTADFLVRQNPVASAYVIGEGGLLNALQEVGIAFDSINPDFVVIGEGRSVNFEVLEKATRFMAKGCPLVVTNPDTWCPTDAGPRPGAGAVAALLESATGKKAFYLGKPNAFMYLMARHKLGLRTNEVIMIGDTMETDIRGATEMGIQSYLVLTGSTKPEDVANYAYRPTRVLNSIADLVCQQERVEAEPLAA